MSIDYEKTGRYLDCFYKPNFEAISEDEIYKWDALQSFKSIRFLDGWYDEAEPFRSRFVEAIDSLENLLNGQQYYARNCLLDCAKLYPIVTKKALSDLFFTGRNVSDALTAMDAFESEMRRLISLYNGAEIYLKSFTGYRAAALLLFFMYPETYFFYKSKEYHAIKSLIGFEPDKSLSDFENCQVMSKEILEYVRKDNELCTWYEARRKQYEGIDPEYHLLIQDILWSTRYYDDTKPNGGRLLRGRDKTGKKWKVEIISNPSYTMPGVELTAKQGIDYEGIQRRNTELGLDGERFVLRYEEDRLRRLFPDDEAKRPQHVSVDNGDGLGFDILSFDEKGRKIYIEVKTTTKAYDTPFTLTEAEHIRSSVEKQQFYLYRVYNFKDGAGDIGITAGSMEKYCQRAVAYRVILKK